MLQYSTVQYSFRLLTPGSARTAYAERKAELLGKSNAAYNFDSTTHSGHMANHISPGAVHRTPKTKGDSPNSGNGAGLLKTVMPI